MAEKFDVRNHVLVAKHEKLAAAEKKDVFSKYGITVEELPKILIADAAIAHLDTKVGDVIKITRPSLTAGVAVFYRGVVHE